MPDVVFAVAPAGGYADDVALAEGGVGIGDKVGLVDGEVLSFARERLAMRLTSITLGWEGEREG